MRKQKSGGKVRVLFQRQFIKGPLEGITHTDGITHVDRWHAAQWLKGVRANTRRGTLEYRISRILAVVQFVVCPIRTMAAH